MILRDMWSVVWRSRLGIIVLAGTLLLPCGCQSGTEPRPQDDAAPKVDQPLAIELTLPRRTYDVSERLDGGVTFVNRSVRTWIVSPDLFDFLLLGDKGARYLTDKAIIAEPPISPRRFMVIPAQSHVTVGVWDILPLADIEQQEGEHDRIFAIYRDLYVTPADVQRSLPGATAPIWRGILISTNSQPIDDITDKYGRLSGTTRP